MAIYHDLDTHEAMARVLGSRCWATRLRTSHGGKFLEERRDIGFRLLFFFFSFSSFVHSLTCEINRLFWLYWLMFDDYWGFCKHVECYGQLHGFKLTRRMRLCANVMSLCHTRAGQRSAHFIFVLPFCSSTARVCWNFINSLNTPKQISSKLKFGCT